MSDFLEKHGISLEKPRIEDAPISSLLVEKEKYIKISEVFTFDNPIHFARFVLSNKDSLKDFSLSVPILNSVTAYNRACCGDSRRNWQRIIDGFSRDFIKSLISDEKAVFLIKSLLHTGKVIYKSKSEPDISF